MAETGHKVSWIIGPDSPSDSMKNFSPSRIICLVPSLTELLWTLELGNKVIGITKFCIRPEHWFRAKTRIGGTKNLDFSNIIGLGPDLVIANKEENTKEQIEQLAEEVSVLVTDILNLKDALQAILDIGRWVGHQIQARELVKKIENNFFEITPSLSPLKSIYLIWKSPYMAAGQNTFINSMLTICGLKNLATGRYPELTSTEIANLNPDIIFLSSEPYPFAEKHIIELQGLCPNARIALVDGEMFSWYGSRLVHAPAYFNELIGQIEME